MPFTKCHDAYNANAFCEVPYPKKIDQPSDQQSVWWQYTTERWKVCCPCKVANLQINQQTQFHTPFFV